MSEAVLDIIHRIDDLPEADRLILEEHLSRQLEAEWLREAQKAREFARTHGIDQVAIDRAVDEVRYPR